MPEIIKNRTAKNCYTLISKGRYEYNDMKIKLDTFYLNNSITKDEYDYLIGMMIKTTE